MINLLLVLLMIAALAGMVLCGRFRRRRPALQLIAVLLLMLVLVSGAMFMWRTGALTMLGFSEQKQNDDSELKLAHAYGCVVAHYLQTICPDEKVLIVVPKGARNRNAILLEELAKQGFSDVSVVESHPASIGDDALITEGSSIDEIIERNPEAQAVILSGFDSSGDALANLKVYQRDAESRPAIIVLGLLHPAAWIAEQIQSGVFSAVVVTDLSRISDSLEEPLSDNPQEAFRRRYQLITRENLDRNRQFFH